MMFGAIFWFFTILLLFAPLIPITTSYFLTWGGVVAVLVSIFRFPIANLNAIAVTILLCLYPVANFGLHLFFNSSYIIPVNDFIQSYALLGVSIVITCTAFFASKHVPQVPVIACLTFLTALGGLQFLMTRLFNNTIGFDLVSPLISFDIWDSYLNLKQTEYARAIGTYYEPSMFGRVIATLSAMLLVKSGRPLLPVAFIAINVIFSQSLGLILLGFVIFVLWYARPSARWIPAGALLAGAVYFSYTFLEQRLVTGIEQRGSAYVRLIAPLETVIRTVSDYPTGAPVGANEAITARYLTPIGFKEKKITNAVYELILYTGIPGLVLLGWGIWLMFARAVRGRREHALIAAMLLLGPLTSSSFLSVESSLLTYVLILWLRAAAQKSPALALEREEEIPGDPDTGRSGPLRMDPAVVS